MAKDVCDVLGVKDSRTSINLLDEDERQTVPVIDSMGRSQDTFIINEPGLYSLILRSRKPEAKEFKRWITHDVLPQIRTTGQYTQLTTIQLLEIAIKSETERLKLQEQVKILEPKAEAFDFIFHL